MYTNPRILYNSQDPKNTKSCFNFKRTVLQGYLELEAGTGTTWKLTLSTFTLKNTFRFRQIFGLLIWRKQNDFGSDFGSITPFDHCLRCECLPFFQDLSRDMRHIPYVKLGRPQYVSGVHSLWIWGPNSRLNETTTIKNNPLSETWN